MIATITLQFYYDEREHRSPDQWDWRDLIDSSANIKVRAYSEEGGRACYFCGDPILDANIKWLEAEDLGKVPFHAGCYPTEDN